MTRALYRRLDRLTEQITAGRLMVLQVAHERVDDHELIDATLAASGIERSDADLTVLAQRYGHQGTEPPCALLSVWPLPPRHKKALR